MKSLITLILVASSLAGVAQTHQIGLSGGLNTISSWNEDPPLGRNSPFDSKLGYSINLSYAYVFENNIVLSLRNSLTFLNFQADNSIAFMDENNEVVRADLNLINQNYQVSLGGGYVFQMGDGYALGVNAGVSMLYFFKEVSFSVGYPETRNEVELPWRDKNRFYGVFLAIDNSYKVYRSHKYSVSLTGSLRATQVFNYLDLDANLKRVLPEFTLGVAVSFGKSGGSRF